MTAETPNPTEQIQPPASPETKLALDEFSEAMGDTEQPTATEQKNAPITPPNSDPTSGLEALYDIPVNITVVLGRTHIEVTDLLALNKGDIIELDRKVGEAIDIYVNNRLVARGEVVLVDDRLGITMTEIIKSNQVG
jgi:flagellar motor switch protein FliN/FliY